LHFRTNTTCILLNKKCVLMTANREFPFGIASYKARNLAEQGLFVHGLCRHPEAASISVTLRDRVALKSCLAASSSLVRSLSAPEARGRRSAPAPAYSGTAASLGRAGREASRCQCRQSRPRAHSQSTSLRTAKQCDIIWARDAASLVSIRRRESVAAARSFVLWQPLPSTARRTTHTAD
jgi:hypothetical protein